MNIIVYILLTLVFMAMSYMLGTIHGYDEGVDDTADLYESFGDRVIIVKERS